MSEYKSLFRNRNFIFLWGSQLFSQITINILNFALLYKIFEQTGSTIATSMLWVSYALPSVLVGPFAAASVDLLDRKKVLVITNMAQAVVILLFALSFRTSFYLLYGVVIAYSLLNQFYVPAEMASLPSIIKRKSLASANSLFLITQQAAIVVGFGSAGFLISILGFINTLYLSSFFLLAAFVSAMRLPLLKSANKLEEGMEKSVRGFFITIWEGYEYIKSNNYVLGPLVVLLMLHTMLTITVINVPVIAERIIDIPIQYSGILMAVPAGLGAGLGALILPRFLRRGFRKIRLMRLAFFLMTLSFYLIIFLVPQLSLIPKLIISVIAIFMLGSSYVGAMVPTQTYLQQVIPNSFMGRVFGNYWFLAMVVSVFPVIFSGTITEIFGIKMLLFSLSMISLGFLYFLSKHAESFIKRGFSFSPKADI